jgi:mono/diheme cytochrome c family protein
MVFGPDRTGAETDEYERAVPADFPPYFRLAQHSHQNYLGTGMDVRTEAYLSIFTFGAGNPNPREAEVPLPPRARVNAFLAFLGAIEAPAPPAGDAAMIAAGRAVFERERCIECHHDDPMENGISDAVQDEGATELFPGDDPMHPYGVIRTDFLHRVIQEAGDGMDEGFANLLNFIIAHGLHAGPSDGYRIPDLAGLWATAPYLHNGSVPTVEDLLRPAAERPATFMRGDFPFDTAVPGNSNQGHEFGTSISEADRTALAAYLLSL